MVNTPALDKEGFLQNFRTWTVDVADELASTEGIELTPEHWEIIHVARNYYATYGIAPITRVLVKAVQRELGADKGRSIYLMQLFTAKPARVIAKIAGLPKPNNCD